VIVGGRVAAGVTGWAARPIGPSNACQVDSGLRVLAVVTAREDTPLSPDLSDRVRAWRHVEAVRPRSATVGYAVLGKMGRSRLGAGLRLGGRLDPLGIRDMIVLVVLASLFTAVEVDVATASARASFAFAAAALGR
jgi:hypothetical protein